MKAEKKKLNLAKESWGENECENGERKERVRERKERERERERERARNVVNGSIYGALVNARSMLRSF